MELRITKRKEEANLVTHSGTFHPDDVFSTMFMSKIVDNPVVCRVFDPSGVNEDAIVYDIGYGEFDHHGPDALMRDDKIKYCSFGLLWKAYGHKYLEKIDSYDREKLFQAIDEKLVMQIDGIDNGVFPNVDAPYKLIDLDKVIDLFNMSWNENIDNDDNFMIAVSIADKIFERVVLKENSLITANSLVEKEIDKVENNILILEEYMPYKDAIFSSSNPKAKEIKVIITPSNRGGYNIRPMTVSEESRELVVHFSEEFLGLHDDDIKRVSGIETARFVHSGGFIACAETLDGALLLAQNALDNEEKKQ